MYTHLYMYIGTHTPTFPSCLLKSIIISYKENYFSIQLNFLPVPHFCISRIGAILCGGSGKGEIKILKSRHD